jgi:hypothetical protein
MMQKSGRSAFPYEAIGTGGLALCSRPALGWVSRLSDEVILLSYNSRPDIDSKDASILIFLKNGKEQLTVSNGKSVYLKESEQGKGLHVSETATSLWVKPLLLDSGAILIEAGRKFVDANGQVGEEKGQFILAQQGGIPARFNPTQQIFIKVFRSARNFSNDALIQKYGGREYALWKDKAVLELSSGSSTYALFVSSGDYLIYEEGEWRVAVCEELKNDRPVAYVKSVSQKAVEIEVWDEIGFYPLQIKVEAAVRDRLQIKPEVMPSKVRLRSASQVSCVLGKRRMILKQGDWLLKTQTGWRNLRRAEEIEQYLNHRLKGELFIFDAIEKERGQSFMKGHFFDETRTEVESLTVPIDAEKSPRKTSRKRKTVFSSIQQRAA